MQNSDFWTRITNLYGSQATPVVLCMQYSVISTRITCPYGSQPLSEVFACKTASFGAELQVSIGPRHDLSFLWLKKSVISTWNTSLYRSKPSSEVFTCKKGLLDPNNNSLWVPDLTCPFVHAKHRHLRLNIKSIWVPALSCGFWAHITACLAKE